MAVVNMDDLDLGSWALLVTLSMTLSLLLGRCGEDLAGDLLAANRHSFYAKHILGYSSQGRNVPTQP